MDSSNLQGVLIQWTKPKSEIDFNNVQSTDWKYITAMQCPIMDGSALPDLGDNYEWLANEQGIQPMSYDSRLHILKNDSRPTNTPHSQFPNYNRFFTSYELEHRSVEEVSASIIQEEKMANTSLDTEADVATMNTFVLGYLAAKAEGIDPVESQINAYNRQGYVQLKKAENAGNRIALIAEITNGNYNIDISAGWERDNIKVGGFPFSN
jgi:hypothetical protein